MTTSRYSDWDTALHSFHSLANSHYLFTSNFLNSALATDSLKSVEPIQSIKIRTLQSNQSN